MRHEKISKARIAAAAWPTTMDGLVLAEPSEALTEPAVAEPAPSLPTPAAPDIAAGVGGLIAASYASLLLVFFAFFAGSFTALFVITICAGLVAVYFTIPYIFFTIEPDETLRPSLPTFMHKGMDTLTGHSSGRDALIQMMVVPVLRTLGLLAMGIAGKIYL